MGSALPLNVLKQIVVPEQKVYNGVPFPFAITPARSTNLVEVVQAHKPLFEAKLHEAGAVLFRGFDVPTVSDFNNVLEAFDYEHHHLLVPGAAPRPHVVGRIYTSGAPPPPHLSIPFHNEMAYMQARYRPSKGFFYCEVEATSQGETPFVLGHVVYERMKKKHFEFLCRLEEHGFIYSKVLPHENEPSSAIVRSWKSTFSTDNKIIAEQKARDLGWKLEWQDNGVKIIMGPVPGIEVDKSRGDEERRIWFNGAITSYADTRNKTGDAITLGDGSPIPLEVLEDCKVILEEECVAIPWRQGDVFMLDNEAVQHARRPFTPPRRVFIAFCK